MTGSGAPDMGNPEYVWYTLGSHTLLGIGVLVLFMKTVGQPEEREE